MGMQAAVRDEASHAAGTGRTVVFAGTVNAADEVAEVLARNGVEVVLYHRKISVPAQVGSRSQTFMHAMARQTLHHQRFG